ncbi:MAG: stage V sporulation protein D [Bacilli bacterium]|jgi:stage V sporulation protein D (sporulation-specific penicillin-binding protein)|nr:stage V sporulation protein D [Bacilli bacterium]
MFFSDVHTRIRFVFLVVLAILLSIILRVFYIQVFQYEKLSTLAESLWSRELPITADRGEILDRNGKILATNITTTSLVVIPNQIVDPERTARELSNILGSDYNDMFSHVTKKTSIERVHPEGRQLSYDIASKIDDLQLDGVYLVKESKRFYPYGSVLAHALGYVGIDNQGLSGLELYYDSYLTGANGAIKYFSDGKGNRLELTEVYEEPQDGINLQLTIDLDLQLAVERELDNVMSKYTPERALILAMNPKTGEVLAMASRPTFDSNRYQDSTSEVINRNLPIWMTYEPGSTFKIMTLAASMEEKTVNLFEDDYFDSGSIQVDSARIHCWKHGGHGAQKFLNVVENSCNPGFVVMGQKLGTETLMKYIRNFGFGSKTGIDLNGESNGILFKLEKMGPVELATTSFGQGISVTPIQQVTAVSAAVNGGNLYTPYIVKSMLEPETNVIIQMNSPRFVRKVISDESSSLVRYALESVVAHGSGRNSYIENYRIGGKTGTAQKVQNGVYMSGNYILSFMGFMPAEDPELVLYVSVDNPKGVVQYGGTVAAPIAKSVFQSAIEIFDFKPTKDGMEREYNWLDTKYVILPDVVGLDLKEAQKVLNGFHIEYSGEGETVTYQSPKSGYYIKEGGTVKLLLN